MRRLLPVLALALSACEPSARISADLVLVGGPIVTLAGDPAEGIAVRGEEIVAVGTEEDVRRYIGADTRVVELNGRSVLPGLTDNHFHSIGGGPGVDLSTARSIQDVLDAIATRARETPPGTVLVTNSDWHEGQLTEQHLPYRDDLDRAAPDHPVVAIRGGHEYILNSAALQHWGIDPTTEEVPGGRIGRYPDGRLNGELVDRAQSLVTLPRPPFEIPSALRERLAAEHAAMNRRGLTSLRYPGGSVTQYQALAAMHEAGALTVRVDYLFRAPRAGSPEDFRRTMAQWPHAGPDPTGRWMRVGGVKLGVDGGFEGGLMRDLYEAPWDEGGKYYGLQTMPREAFFDALFALDSAGWRVATHAVGDAAIDLVLDGYEAVHARRSLSDAGWVIEHGFIPREDQFPRMREMGLHLSVQNHLYLAAPSLVEYWGGERAAWTTPLRAYIDAGIPVSLGTDSPVVPDDPWWVLHHFTTRGTISAGTVGADQAVTRMEALRAMVEGFARLTRTENEIGVLRPGNLADLIVTAEDYLACADPCLETMEVDLTVVGGRVVWER